MRREPTQTPKIGTFPKGANTTAVDPKTYGLLRRSASYSLIQETDFFLKYPVFLDNLMHHAYFLEMKYVNMEYKFVL